MVLVLSCLSLFESCSPALIMYVGCMALLMTYAMILYWVYNEILHVCMGLMKLQSRVNCVYTCMCILLNDRYMQMKYFYTCSFLYSLGQVFRAFWL